MIVDGIVSRDFDLLSSVVLHVHAGLSHDVKDIRYARTGE
jgi:hypothetical protein